MLTEATLVFHTPTQIASSTFGLVPPPSLFSPGSIPTCGNSPIKSIGMTKRFCLSNTTGKRPVKGISHTSSSGISTWTRTTGIPTILTGPCTFLRLSDDIVTMDSITITRSTYCCSQFHILQVGYSDSKMMQKPNFIYGFLSTASPLLTNSSIWAWIINQGPKCNLLGLRAFICCHV